MKASLKTATRLIGLLLIIASLTSGLINKHSTQVQSTALVELNEATELMRGHMNADMLHDTIRSDVLTAIMASEAQDRQALSEARDNLETHVSNLRDRIEQDRRFKGDSQVMAKAAMLPEPVDAYIEIANSIVTAAGDATAAATAAPGETPASETPAVAEAAPADVPAADAPPAVGTVTPRSMLPAFNARFEELEDKMEATSEAIARHADKVRTDANATAAEGNLMAMGSMAAMILIALMTTFGAHRYLVMPLVRLTDDVERIANDDLDFETAQSRRQDELGRLNHAVETLRQGAIEARRLRQEMQGEQRRAEEAAIASLSHALGGLAEGRLDMRINETFPENYEGLRVNLNTSMDKLEQLILDIIRAADSIRTGSNEIRAASSDLASRTEHQASTLEETAAALTEATTSVRQTAQKAAEINRTVDSAHSGAVEGSHVVESAIEAMQAIESSSKEIFSIIDLIESITFQTNLLALNAGVEAARAGEAGRGFAVVASEVRALAQRSADAANNIKELISNSSSQVEQGVALVDESGQALRRISTQVGDIRSLISEIAVATDHQSEELVTVNATVSEMDRTTQQNAAMVEQSAAASHHLAAQADTLTQLVSRFALSSASAGMKRAA